MVFIFVVRTVFILLSDITGLWKQSFELIFDSLQSREIVLFYFWENLINVIFKNCFLGLEIDLISTQWTSPFFFALPLLRGHPSIIHTSGLSLFWKRWPQERVSNRKWQLMKYIQPHMLLPYYFEFTWFNVH